MAPVTVANFNTETTNFSDAIDTPVLNTLRSSANAQEFATRITAVGDNTFPTIIAELNLLIAYQTSILTAGERVNATLTAA